MKKSSRWVCLLAQVYATKKRDKEMVRADVGSQVNTVEMEAEGLGSTFGLE